MQYLFIGSINVHTKDFPEKLQSFFFIKVTFRLILCRFKKLQSFTFHYNEKELKSSMGYFGV